MTKPNAAFPQPFGPATATAPSNGLDAGATEAERQAFFRAPPPPGRSRESRIVLDAEGRFSQDGALVDHDKLAEAFHRWISRHPDDGRYVLSNGLDWSYFTVEDAPYFVRRLTERDGGLLLSLSDGSEEPLVAEQCRASKSGALYTEVKRAQQGGPYPAKFTRHAQTALAPYLEERAGRLLLRLGDSAHPLGGDNPEPTAE